MSNNRFRDYAHTVLGQLPTRTAHDFFKNLKANWYFPLSALAFFWPQVQWLVEPEIWHVSLAITFICMIFISGQLTNLWNETRAHGWFVQMWTLLSACGILLRSQRFAYDALAGNASFQALVADSSANMARFVSVALALGGFLFIYICLCWFWSRLGEMLRDCLLFSKLTRWEWALYILLALAEILCMARIFFATTAFYTNDPSGYDIIYTSDSGALVNNMGYLFITFPENDLRQPLFALFAAPFLGAPYFLGQILQLSPTSQAILVDAVQIVMLVLANLLLTRLLDLKPLERAALMLITSFTYAQMLGVLMMEQYIVAYFWLALTLALLAANRETISSNITGGYKPHYIALYGAGSTLLTSLFWTPLHSAHSPFRDFRKWFLDMLKCGFGFIALLFVFGRYDVFATLIDKIESLNKFTGKAVPLSGRIEQYTAFIHDIFLTPAASAGLTGTEPATHISWMLAPVEQLNLVGLVILALALVSLLLNRHSRAARMAGCWILFSLALLVGLGWGTKENGLILYALYFGWAYVLLLFQLLLKLSRYLQATWLLVLFSLLITALLAGVNIPGILEIVHFGLEYFVR